MAFARSARPGVVGYLGWSGRGNLGDDAIYVAHRRHTVPEASVAVPVHNVARTSSRARLVRRGLRLPVLLGGGTVVGRGDWLERARALETSGVVSSWALLGTGVEDPEFRGVRQHATWDDLRGWAELLGRFGPVSVRGPSSQALLAEVGVASELVGDPALLLADAHPQAGVQEDLVGFSIAVPEDLWGGDPAATVAVLADTVKGVVASGRRVRLVALHPGDAAVSRDVAATLGTDRVEVVVPADVDALLDAVRPCAAFVGQRLHAVVLAAATYVPALAVEYRPKCLDFQQSLGRAEWSLSTRGLTAAHLLERLEDLLADRPAQVRDLQRGVGLLAARLQAHVPSVRAQLGLLADAEPARSTGA